MTYINHMTVQRSVVKSTGDVIYVHFKKPRRPRKWKKEFFKRCGYNWNKNITTGWMLPNDYKDERRN